MPVTSLQTPQSTFRAAQDAGTLALPAAGRRVALLAVHHLNVDGFVFAGGAEKYIQMTIRALLRSGASVHVGYSGVSIYDELLDVTEPHRLTVEHTGWLDESLSGDRDVSVALLRRRRRWLRAAGADTLFVVQQDHGAAFLTSLLAARTLGLRVVSSIRQMPPSLPSLPARRLLRVVPMPRFWRRRVTRRQRWPARLCDAVILNSRRVADAYIRQYGLREESVRIIFNGEPPASCPRRTAAREAVCIGTSGRVTPAKGADVLYDAFKLIAGRFPRARLAYFGDGPLAGELRGRAGADGLGHRVEFAGYSADRDDMHDRVDIYVQASRRESMSNSVIEAMARGKPCIVTDVGGLPEAVAHGECGYVVPPGCARSLADALAAILSEDGAIDRLGEAAQRRARRLFDMRRFERETVSTILGIREGAID
ncbi:MAG: hypothetical protein DCC65_04895 [Planctomycetota bacterium]|nr:MAG: hypothetical protein DCC65_04895 [Planctomycetota bacterium]